MMSTSPFKKDNDVSFELSDSDDGTSAIEEMRCMIRRPDWFEVFKKQCEEQELVELKQKIVKEPPVISVEDTECVSESKEVTSTARKAQKHKNTKIIKEPEDILLEDTSESEKEVTFKSRRQKNKKKPTKLKRTPQKTSRKARHQGTVCPTGGDMRRSKRRCAQRNASQNVDPQIVFLSDDEPEILGFVAANATSAIPACASVVTDSNDGIEIISESCKATNHKEQDFEPGRISIFFTWRTKVLKLPMKEGTQFGTVVPELLNKWEVPGAHLMLLYHDKIIKAGDTPSDHEMLSGSIVECSIVKSKTVDMSDPNVITIKLQMKNTRDKKQMAVNQMCQFISIINQFADEVGVPVDKITFKFDGDAISPTDTPFGLGIENDFSIDVIY